MEERTSENKEMPYGVHISYFVAKSVEDRSDGVDHTACYQHYELIVRQRCGNILVGEDDAPAGSQVAYHGGNGIFFQINEIKGDTYHRRESDNGKNNLSREVVHHHERVGGIGAGYQQKDRAVIHDLELLFSCRKLPSVVKC